MKILVINCGSTTIKFQFIDMEKEELIAKGRCEQIGIEGSTFKYNNLVKKLEDNREVEISTHKEGMQIVIEALLDKKIGCIDSLSEISAIGHRVVHGGEDFSTPVIITDEVLEKINELSELAPLHNPGAVMGISAVKEVAPSIPNVAVFDTAFHQDMPDFNYIYGIKYEYYEKFGIRRYGFHGTSYMYILERLSKIMVKPETDINAIVCHLGGGASICAIKEGKSYDTSMGFTPVEGLLMETRCGDIDASIVLKLMEKEKLDTTGIYNVLNKESGRLGLCGIGDQRLLIAAANSGDERAILTRKIQANRTKKYIGGYMAELGRVDAVVFTGGVGENNYCEREMILSNLENLGIILDEKLNFNSSGKEAEISTRDSKVKVYIIPTNEELEIAKQTKELIENI